MASDFEVFFDYRAKEMGWEILGRGWPDRMVTKPTGETFAVEIKHSDDPLKLHQQLMAALLTSLGVKVFVAVDGNPENLKPFEEWRVTAYGRGRPSSGKLISRKTMKAYGYKRLTLQNQLESAKRIPEFPRELLQSMEFRLKQIDEKVKRFLGSENEMDKSSSAEVEEVMVSSGEDFDNMLNKLVEEFKKI
jgi:hypothetical protein